MTKKHFIALAQAMKNNKPTYNDGALDQWHMDVKRLLEVCRMFNSNFDTTRFMLACGVE